MIQKFFWTCRDYERVYREGLQGKAVEENVKLEKSHWKNHIGGLIVQ